MVQAVIWCLGEIAGTLIRFAAYCAVVAAATMAAWMLVTNLFVGPEGEPAPARAPAAVEWLDGAGMPPLRRLSE